MECREFEEFLGQNLGVGHVLTCPDVFPLGCKPQVPTPVQASTQPTTRHVRA